MDKKYKCKCLGSIQILFDFVLEKIHEYHKEERVNPNCIFINENMLNLMNKFVVSKRYKIPEIENLYDFKEINSDIDFIICNDINSNEYTYKLFGLDIKIESFLNDYEFILSNLDKENELNKINIIAKNDNNELYDNFQNLIKDVKNYQNKLHNEKYILIEFIKNLNILLNNSDEYDISITLKMKIIKQINDVISQLNKEVQNEKQ